MTEIGNLPQHWGLAPMEGHALPESRSSANVKQVRSKYGQAILKVTARSDGGPAMEEARREHTFYTQVAPSLPRVAPRLLEAYDGHDGVALLLEHVGLPMAVTRKDDSRWASLADKIAQVHRLGPSELPVFTRSTELENALTAVHRSSSQEFWSSLEPPVAEVIDCVRERVPPLLCPDAFVHGDLHLENVLVSEDHVGIRVADWQQCGSGSAAADLAFINVRLAPSSERVPRAFWRSYAAAIERDVDELERAAAYVELATYLLVWPPFAAYNSPQGVSAVRARTAELAAWATSQDASQ